MNEVKLSPLYQAINPIRGTRWVCAGHMCRSMWLQKDWNGRVVCNGCLGFADVGNHPLTTKDGTMTPVYQTTLGRELTTEEIGYTPTDATLEGT